jgi:hypothetical protein
VAISAFLVVLCVVARASGETTAAASNCGAGRSHTVLRSAQARVYRRGVLIYGCAFATGKRRVLGTTYQPQRSSSGGGGITHMRLTGRYAAVVSVFEDESGRLAGIYVTDLHTGRTSYHWEVGADGMNGSAGDADVTDLVLAANGSVAYIEGIGGPAHFNPPTRLIVRRHDKRGDTILEDSPTVAPTSLTLTGHQLAWQTSDAVRTSTLRQTPLLLAFALHEKQ